MNERLSYLPNGKGGMDYYEVKKLWRLLIGSNDLQKLVELGYSPKRLIINKHTPQRNATQFVKISDILDNGEMDKTFCFTEKFRHAGIFNGVITSQCEIMEVSNDKEYSVCNLNSIAVNRFIKYPVYTSIFRMVTKTNCKYCTMAKYKLNKLGYKFEVIELEGEELFEKMEELSDKYKTELSTFPIIELGDKLIGGFDELQKYIVPEYDFSELKKVAGISTRNINKIINSSLHPVKETLVSDMENRPIGVGIQGLADTFAELGYAFESPEARVLNHLIFETIYYGCVEESINLAMEHEKELNDYVNGVNKDKKTILQNYTDESHLKNQLAKKKYKGAYPRFEGSPSSEGKLQFDLWGFRADYDSNLSKTSIIDIISNYKFTDTKFTAYWDWNTLKKKLKKYGMINSLLTALMPTASTSQLLGNNECFEPFTSNIYRRDTIAGSFVCINKHLVRDLKLVHKWNKTAKENIIVNNGSVQGLSDLSDELKNRYKTKWEIKQRVVIDLASDRGKFIDQSQSMNIAMATPNSAKLTSCHFHAWKKGLKTGMYYLHTRPASEADKFSIANSGSSSDDCLMCSA
jgi:ribonucleotide reductase alpha subunit